MRCRVAAHDKPTVLSDEFKPEIELGAHGGPNSFSCDGNTGEDLP